MEPIGLLKINFITELHKRNNLPVVFLLDVWFEPVVVTHSATDLIVVDVLELVARITLKLTDKVLSTPSTDCVTPGIIG